MEHTGRSRTSLLLHARAACASTSVLRARPVPQNHSQVPQNNSTTLSVLCSARGKCLRTIQQLSVSCEQLNNAVLWCCVQDSCMYNVFFCTYRGHIPTPTFARGTNKRFVFKIAKKKNLKIFFCMFSTPVCIWKDWRTAFERLAYLRSP
jgi:hypothetical protein